MHIDKDADLGKLGRDGPEQLSGEDMFENLKEFTRNVIAPPRAVIEQRESEWKAARKDKKALRKSRAKDFK